MLYHFANKKKFLLFLFFVVVLSCTTKKKCCVQQKLLAKNKIMQSDAEKQTSLATKNSSVSALEEIVLCFAEHSFADTVSQPCPNHQKRQVVLKKIQTALEQCRMDGCTSEIDVNKCANATDWENMGTLVEHNLHRDCFCTHGVQFYCDRALQVIFALQTEPQFLLNHFECTQWHLLTNEQLCARRYASAIQQELALSALKTENMAEGLFECPKCHSKLTRHKELQTRSADEPATIFIHCFNCGKRSRE